MQFVIVVVSVFCFLCFCVCSRGNETLLYITPVGNGGREVHGSLTEAVGGAALPLTKIFKIH